MMTFNFDRVGNTLRNKFRLNTLIIIAKINVIIENNIYIRDHLY